MFGLSGMHDASDFQQHGRANRVSSYRGGVHGSVDCSVGPLRSGPTPSCDSNSFASQAPSTGPAVPSARAGRSGVEAGRHFNCTASPALDRGAGRHDVDGVVRMQPPSLDLGSQPYAAEDDEDSLMRTLGSKSYDTVMKLSDFRSRFDDIDASMERLIASLQTSGAPLGKTRGELAQLEATLDRLQCKGVDSVDTFELSSGKELARSIRKELTGRAEKMHARMDEGFKAIKCAQNVQQQAQL